MSSSNPTPYPPPNLYSSIQNATLLSNDNINANRIVTHTLSFPYPFYVTFFLCNHIQASVVATLTAMIVQVIVFAAGGAGYSRSWLVMMCGGVVGLLGVLIWMFSRSRRNIHGGDSTNEYIEAKGVLFQCMLGYTMLVLFASVMYAVFALIFSQYRTVGNGAVGIALAAIYPLLRIALIRGVEVAKPTRWGYGRGQLCAGVQATVIATAWHAAFLCLIAGCIATQYELLLMAVVDTAIIGGAMVMIDRLPRAQKRGESTTR